MRYALQYVLGSCSVIAIYLFGFYTVSASNTDELERNETMVDVLKRDLLVNYDKFARPAYQNNATKIDVRLDIKHLDINELDGIMTIYGWVSMVWIDKSLAWDPKSYDGIKEINIPGHEIWQPDLYAYNSASDNIDHYGNTLNVVLNDGKVIWVPPAQFQIFCDLDFKLWPFDTQTCTLILGSTSYNPGDVELNYVENIQNHTERYVENHEWMIKGVSVNKTINDCCLRPFESITYTITVERRAPMYRTVVITPASCVIVLILSSFWIPAHSGEKIFLNSIVIIIIFAFMMYFAHMLPTLAVSTPLVVLFYSSSLILVTFSMIIAVLVLYLANNQHQRAVPEFLKNLLNGPLSTVLCLSHLNPKKQTEPQDKELQEEGFEDHATDEEHPAIEESPKCSIQQDWLVLATAIDRICFLIYSIVFIVLAATYSV